MSKSKRMNSRLQSSARMVESIRDYRNFDVVRAAGKKLLKRRKRK